MKQNMLFLLLTILISSSVLFSQSIKLGIITDFPEDDTRLSKIQKMFIQEIRKTVGGSKEVTLSSSDLLSSNWSTEKTKEHYSELVKRCDLILTLGSVSSKGVVEYNNFTKPTLSIGIFDTEVQGIPYSSNGTSGTNNFSYILTSKNLESELNTFHDIRSFKNLALLVDKNSTENFDYSKGKLKLKEISLDGGFNIIPVRIGANISESLSKLPENIDAVYIAMNYERSEIDIKEIADILIDKKIPSFSINNNHVDLGILSSISSENGLEQIIRKLAVMADGAINGEKLSEMQVNINQKEQLFFNQLTAQKINFVPPFKVLFTANLVNSDSLLNQPIFSLSQIIEKGMQENLNIKISNKDLELSEKEISEAYSQFLPTIEVSGNASFIDEHRTNPLAGIAEQSIKGTGKLQMLIYSEKAIANIKIKKLLNKAQNYATKDEINTLIVDYYTSYFNILRAKINVAIQRETLSLSQKNLSLTKLKSNIGSVGMADVYRWESELANSTQSLIDARAKLTLAKIVLNTKLNGVLPEMYAVEDIELENDLFMHFTFVNLNKFLQRPNELKLITKFFIQQALENNSLKKELVLNKEVLERQTLMNQRLYYTPTIALQAQMDEVFYRDGEGSTPMTGQTVEDNSWNVGLNISYPLFDGNRRHINLQKGKIQSKQIDLRLKNLDNNLSLNIKSKTIGMLTSSTNLEYSKKSSFFASKNFKLVQNSYNEGATTLITLLDAQKMALASKLNHSNSVYDYLIKFIELENSIGQFHILASEIEKEKYLNKLKQFLIKNNLSIN